MTHTIGGKILIGVVLMVGSAGASQWQFQRDTTLVPAGVDEVARGIQSLRVHAPVASAAGTITTIDFLDLQQKEAGRLVDTKAARVVGASSKDAPEETLVLEYEGRRTAVHYRNRAMTIDDGREAASVSFDAAVASDSKQVANFADELRLIGNVQVATRATIEQLTGERPVIRAGVSANLGLDRVARVVPASWTTRVRAWTGRAAGDNDTVCHTEPAHAKCAGGFGVSRSSACAYSQQEAQNACAAASGWCIGCCAWVGSGCDCSCAFGDLACMCESCGGTCGPAEISPSATGAPADAPARTLAHPAARVTAGEAR